MIPTPTLFSIVDYISANMSIGQLVGDELLVVHSRNDLIWYYVVIVVHSIIIVIVRYSCMSGIRIILHLLGLLI